MAKSRAEYQRRWRSENPDRVRRYSKSYHATHPDAAHRNAAIKKKKMDDRRQELLDAQGGVCAICGTDNPGSKYGWHIDHDHSCCDKVTQDSCTVCDRGALCYSCNLKIVHVLEVMKANPSILPRALQYLGLTLEDLGVAYATS